MNFVGVDLHRKTISVCVVILEDGKRKVSARKNLRCADVDLIDSFFRELGRFQVVVEATATYEWFAKLVEPMADRLLIAHPKKLRVIAESTRKTDKLDAQVLAEFLSLDMIPEAHRPPPRVREHRRLVRHRQYVVRRRASIKTKLRWILASYNADIRGLFTEEGRKKLKEVSMSEADRFITDRLLEEFEHHSQQVALAEKRLQEFAKQAPIAEREARELLETIPCVGAVTIDIVSFIDVQNLRRGPQAIGYLIETPDALRIAGRWQLSYRSSPDEVESFPGFALPIRSRRAFGRRLAQADSE